MPDIDRFDLIRIINLPSRRDRRREMLRELAKVGLAGDARVAFFTAVRPSSPGPFSSIGAHGVYRSHCAILAEAAELGKSVLILEDDCDLSTSTVAYESGVPWDIFYGGYYPSDPSDLEHSGIVGAHMMGFSAHCIPKLLKFLTSIRTSEAHPPIDGAYVWFRRAHPEIISHFSSPPLGNQRPSRSDIEPGRFYNRIPVLRSVVNFLRQLRRAYSVR